MSVLHAIGYFPYFNFAIFILPMLKHEQNNFISPLLLFQGKKSVYFSG